MKSHGGIFPTIVAPANLRAAMDRAARGKRQRPEVANFIANADAELARLHDELCTGCYQPGSFHQFAICDPKPRLISCADFRDRVVHHAVCASISPPIERRLIHDNYACRRGKGSHRAVLRAQGFSRRFAYWLRLDVQHYYETVDHDILLGMLHAMFREPRLRSLLEVIVRNGPPGARPGKGLPIGSLTSQWFANLYLDGLDHWVTEQRGAGAYMRYMDDMAIWSDSKAGLHALAHDAGQQLGDELGLELKHEATLLVPCTEGMPFLGYRIWPGLIRERPARVRRRRRLLARREAQCRRGEMSEEKLQDCVRAMDGPRQFLGAGEPLVYSGRRSRGSNRVNRGGSWRNDNPSNFRGAYRNNDHPANRNNNLGFRLVSTVSQGKDKLSNPSTPASRPVGTESPRPGAAGNPANAGPTLRQGLLFGNVSPPG